MSIVTFLSKIIAWGFVMEIWITWDLVSWCIFCVTRVEAGTVICSKTHGSVWLAYPRNASAMSELTNQIRLLECIGLPDKIKALVQKVKNDE